MTLLFLAVLALPALAFILWPLLRRGTAPAGLLPVSSSEDRGGELSEEKRALYRALKEIEFDYQAGHLSEDDYRALRNRYEERAAHVLTELDRLEATRLKAAPRGPSAAPSAPGPGRRAWTRSPVAVSAGAVALVVFGLALGLGVARYTEPDQTMVPPGSRLPVPAEAPGASSIPGIPAMGGAASAPAADPSRPISPETFRGMLDAAHQALDAGQFQQAIAAYQAVLRRDPKNVEAITHLGVILSVAGHTEQALEAFDKALVIDAKYAHAWSDKARVLYESRQDYAGAIKAWEKFVALVPPGEDRDRALRQIQEAKGRVLKPER